MNVTEINPGTAGTLPHYFAISLPLTIVTAWIVIAFQSKYIFKEKTHFFKRLGWPAYLFINMIKDRKAKMDEIQIFSDDNSLRSKEVMRGYLRSRVRSCD
jgi:hypothetical protein